MIRLTGIVGAMVISFSAIFVRLADVSPTTAAFFRAAYALPILLLVALAVGGDRRPGERIRAFVSGTLLAVDLALWHLSIEYIGAGLATVVANSQVLWVGLLAWFLLKERPTATHLLVVPVMLLGITLVGGLGRPDAYGDRPGLGAVLALLAGLTYAGFLLLFRSSNPRKVHASGPLFDATAGAAVATLLLSPLDSGFALAPSWPSHGWLLALGLLIQVAGWLLIASVLPRLPALDTSVILLLQPAMTVLWARIIFSEALSLTQWTGTVLVLGGILAVALQGARAVKREAAATSP